MTPVPVLLVRTWRLTAAAAIIAAVVTAIIVVRMPTGVDTSVTYTIPVPKRPPSGQYEYDGFYALQATDLFASTLTGWLTSPDLVSHVYRDAGYPEPATSVRQLSHVFTARKVSGQLVELEYHARNDAESHALADAVKKAINERTDAFNTTGNTSLTFDTIAGDPLIVPVKHSVPLLAAIAALTAAIIVMNVIIFWDATTNPDTVDTSA